MSASQTIDVTSVIEQQRPNRLVLSVILVSIAIMFLDGYDLQAMAFAAPSIVRAWGIDKAALGVVFSSGIFGILIGGLIFGYLGDRIGRRASIIISTLVFGTFTLAAVWAENISQLTVLRLLAGLGIGGLSPLCYALNLEYVPNRYRGTVVAVIMVGYVVGASAGGVIAASLVPSFGWPIVFWIGGLLPLVAALVCFFVLPESVKFLAVQGRRRGEVARILNKIEPGLAASANAHFIIHDEAQSGVGSASLLSKLAALFNGRLTVITPALWLAYIASSTTMFFLNSWTPILAEASGHTPAQAALALTLLSLGGACGGLIVGFVLDRFGVIAIAIVPLIASALVASLGIAGLSDRGFLAAMFCAGFFVIGGHQGLNSSVGLFYPSANRTTAVGWALSVAKIGSIGGPLIGGILLARQLPLATLFLFAALPPLVVACCVLALGHSQRRKTLAAEKLDQPAPA